VYVGTDADDRAILVTRTMCARGRQEWTRTTGQISVSKNPRQPSDPRPSPTAQLFVVTPLPRRTKNIVLPAHKNRPKGPITADVMRSFAAAAAAVYHHISPETPHRADIKIKNNCDGVTENQYI